MIIMVPMVDTMGLSLFMSLKHLNLEFVSDFDLWISSLFSGTKNTKIIVNILNGISALAEWFSTAGKTWPSTVIHADIDISIPVFGK